MRRSFGKILFCLSITIFLSCLGAGEGLSQPAQEGPLVKLGNVTFRKKEIEAASSTLKVLEVQIEVLNQSQQSVAPPNSTKVVVVPKEVKSPDGTPVNTFAPTSEEATLNAPLPPRTGRVLIIGFVMPKEKLGSIVFEVQINPPEGEKKLVTWSGE
jgi:hypothetical protein